MKKILFVIPSLVCGGAETALLDLCTLLNKEKYEVSVLEYYSDWSDEALKPQFIEAGIRIITPYSKLVPGKNIAHKVYNVLWQEYITHQRRKEKIFIREEFDMIVYYKITNMHIRCLSKPQVISYIHGDIETNEDYRKSVIHLKKRIEDSAKVICVSSLAQKSLEKVAGISKNTVTILNPINSAKIISRSNETVKEQFCSPYICAVGRLVPEKRFDVLVRIHKDLIDRGLPHDLVIVGEGNEREKIESIIRETGTESSVHLLGFKENPYPYMKNSLFTVCSSDTEGLPVISMESLLLGKPIVSSFSTVGELFGEEECGIITETGVKSLEEGIYKMLSDKAFYEKCVEGAKRRSSVFNADQMIQHIEQIFDEVLNKK